MAPPARQLMDPFPKALESSRDIASARGRYKRAQRERLVGLRRSDYPIFRQRGMIGRVSPPPGSPKIPGLDFGAFCGRGGLPSPAGEVLRIGAAAEAAGSFAAPVRDLAAGCGASPSGGGDPISGDAG